MLNVLQHSYMLTLCDVIKALLITLLKIFYIVSRLNSKTSCGLDMNTIVITLLYN